MSTDEIPQEWVDKADAEIVRVIEDKLTWNVNAYGKAWTGEGEDTDFICGGAGAAVLTAVLPLIRSADEPHPLDRRVSEFSDDPYRVVLPRSADDGQKQAKRKGLSTDPFPSERRNEEEN